MIQRERRLQPEIGCRKLHVLIQDELAQQGISIGRDRLFDLMRRHRLLIKPRRKARKTTNSRHHLTVYPNRLVEAVLTSPHQAWVSDLTYLRVGSGFRYLSLITDAYSRKIVGWHLHKNLEATGPLRAVEMALWQLPDGYKPIHHSDRGIQYCCHDYIDLLLDRGLTISMTEDNHCYENGMAERVNGILKHEYKIGDWFHSEEQARKATRQAIDLYNNRRPHMAIGYAIPGSCHRTAA